MPPMPFLTHALGLLVQQPNCFAKKVRDYFGQRFRMARPPLGDSSVWLPHPTRLDELRAVMRKEQPIVSPQSVHTSMVLRHTGKDTRSVVVTYKLEDRFQLIYDAASIAERCEWITDYHACVAILAEAIDATIRDWIETHGHNKQAAVSGAWSSSGRDGERF